MLSDRLIDTYGRRGGDPMPITARVPPGRAGRIWLRRRLATARRGRDQLDRKLRILQPELQRQRIRAARSHEEWAAGVRRGPPLDDPRGPGQRPGRVPARRGRATPRSWS